jgi:hypothetical protein
VDLVAAAWAGVHASAVFGNAEQVHPRAVGAAGTGFDDARRRHCGHALP